MVGGFEDGLVAAEGGDGAEDADGGGGGAPGGGEDVQVGGEDAGGREGHVVGFVLDWIIWVWCRVRVW